MAEAAKDFNAKGVTLDDGTAAKIKIRKIASGTGYQFIAAGDRYVFGEFAGGYSAGYYAYLWAEILDADAFTAFKDSGDIFNPELAGRFNGMIADWREAGIEPECTAFWDSESEALREAADDYGVAMASFYDEFNALCDIYCMTQNSHALQMNKILVDTVPA